MSYRPLELTLISAKDLDKVNLFSKMEVYAVAMIAGDPRSKKKTHTDRDGGRNPNWNATFSFNVMEFDLDRCVLHVVLKAERAFGDREIGEVQVPIKELLNGWKRDAGAKVGPEFCFSDGGSRSISQRLRPETLGGRLDGFDPEPLLAGAQFLSYQVRKPSGKAKGTLNFSYKFKDPVTVAGPPPPQMDAAPYPTQYTKPYKKAEPVTAYPVTGPSGSHSGYPPQSGYAYPPHTQLGYAQSAPMGYPPQQSGYGYPGQQSGNVYPPPQQGGYGYPPPQQGGYYPPQQQQQGRKNKFGGAGLGLGAGLLGGALGGMLIGDMVSDAGNYDGYDGGFDDGGFDF